jgi:hypothetical protein
MSTQTQHIETEYELYDEENNPLSSTEAGGYIHPAHYAAAIRASVALGQPEGWVEVMVQRSHGLPCHMVRCYAVEVQP